MCCKNITIPSWLSVNSISLSLLLSGIHLVLTLLFVPSEDWLIQWYASVDIANGIPLYEQSHKVINDTWINTPYHFPVFFYTVAGLILIVGENQVFGRIFLWICTNVLFIEFLYLIKPNDSREFILVQLLYFLNPFLLGISMMGLFDQFVFLFIITAFLLVESDKPFLAGIAIGLGIMTKFYPIVVLLPLTYQFIKNRKLNFLIELALGTLISTSTIFGYFYFNFSDQFVKRTILWQANRITPSMSIFTYIDSTNLFALELIIGCVLLVIFTAYFFSDSGEIDFYISVSLAFNIFVLSFRSLYPQYGLWFTLILIPSWLRYFSENKGTFFLFVMIDWVLFSLGSLFWSVAFINYSPFDYSKFNNLLYLPSTEFFSFLGTLLSFCALVIHFLLALHVSKKHISLETP